MIDGLHITDFHAHLRGNSTEFSNFCAEDQASAFFRQALPVFERLSHLSEPLHHGFIRTLACNHRDPLSRQIYGGLAQFALMEALRLFKVYDVNWLLKSMGRQGIDRAIICSLEPFISTQEVLEAVRPYRDRLLVFASVARTEPNPVEYFSGYLERGEIAGLKIHPIVSGYACNELYDRTKDVVALAVERDLPILIHTGHIPNSTVSGLSAGCADVRAVEPLVAAFPKGKFVLAHIGWDSWRYILDLAKRHPHVCVETSWQPARIIRRAVDVLGMERVLFGSDFPLVQQKLALAMTRHALTPREFVSVVSTNAERLLRSSFEQKIA